MSKTTKKKVTAFIIDQVTFKSEEKIKETHYCKVDHPNKHNTVIYNLTKINAL